MEFSLKKVIHAYAITWTTLDTWSSDEFQKAQFNIPDIKSILDKKLKSVSRLLRQNIAPSSSTTKTYFSLWDSLHIENGIVNCKWENEDVKTFRWLLVLPRCRISDVLSEINDIPGSVHFGVIIKTLSKTRERFYWDRLRGDVEKRCKVFHVCGARKIHKVRTNWRLHCYNLSSPSKRNALNVLGPLSLISKEYRYIIVVKDYFTKWPLVISVADQKHQLWLTQW